MDYGNGRHVLCFFSYPQNECEHLNAVMSERGVYEACRAAEQRIQYNREHPMTSDLKKIRYKKSNLTDRVGLAQSVACPPLAR